MATTTPNGKVLDYACLLAHCSKSSSALALTRIIDKLFSAKEEYCALNDKETCVEGALIEGTCTTMPQLCTKEIDYVCGCDGNTYNNKCEALSE